MLQANLWRAAKAIAKTLVFLFDCLLGFLIFTVILLAVLLGSPFGRQTIVEQALFWTQISTEWRVETEGFRWPRLGHLRVDELRLVRNRNTVLVIKGLSFDWVPTGLTQRELILEGLSVDSTWVNGDPQAWSDASEVAAGDVEETPAESGLEDYRLIVRLVHFKKLVVEGADIPEGLALELRLNELLYDLGENWREALSLDGIRLELDEGRHYIAGQYRDQVLTADLDFEQFPLQILEPWVPDLKGGWVSARMRVRASEELLTGTGRLVLQSSYRNYPVSVASDLTLDRESVNIHGLAGRWGSLSLAGEGSYQYATEQVAINLNSAQIQESFLRQFDVALPPELRFRVNARSLTLSGPVRDPVWSATLDLSARYGDEQATGAFEGEGTFKDLVARRLTVSYREATAVVEGKVDFSGLLDLTASIQGLRETALWPWVPAEQREMLKALTLNSQVSAGVKGDWSNPAWRVASDGGIGYNSAAFSYKLKANGQASSVTISNLKLTPTGTTRREDSSLVAEGKLDWEKGHWQLHTRASHFPLAVLADVRSDLEPLRTIRVSADLTGSGQGGKLPSVEMRRLEILRDENTLLSANGQMSNQGLRLAVATEQFQLQWLRDLGLAEVPEATVSSQLNLLLDKDNLDITGEMNYRQTLSEVNPRDGSTQEIEVALTQTLQDESTRLALTGNVALNGLTRGDWEGYVELAALQKVAWLAWNQQGIEGLTAAWPEWAFSGKADLTSVRTLVPRWSGEVAGNIALELMAPETALDAVPAVQGWANLNDGRLRIPETGTELSAVNVNLLMAGNRLRIENGTADTPEGGRIELSGEAGWEERWFVDFRTTAQRARLVDMRLAEASFNGYLNLKGDPDGLLLSGDMQVEPLELKISQQVDDGVPEIDVEDNRSATPARWDDPLQPSLLALDLRIRSEQQAFLRGRGLDAELRGDITLQGPVNRLRYNGRFETVRGSMNLFGKRFVITRGVATVQTGAVLLSVQGEYSDRETDYYLRLLGGLDDFEIDISSSPSLPQDELISRLMFGKSVRNITPFQAVSLAAAIQTLQGGSQIPDPVAIAREATGVDQITIESEETEDGESGVRVGVGKYINDRVYVELERTPDPNKPWEGRVDIELTPRINLRTRTGSAGEGGDELLWKKDY